MPSATRTIFEDLIDEFDQLEAVLDSVTVSEWSAMSGAVGWTIRDVVLHLAQTEEAVVSSIVHANSAWNTRDGSLDSEIDAQVQNDPATAEVAFARWRTARRDSVAALREADPSTHVRWAAAPLRPTTLATTRLAEHWAHALDITSPLQIAYPDTDRLRHIAWLGHATLPYAQDLHGKPVSPIRCELVLPSGELLKLGPGSTPSCISGSASEFCRVGALRTTPENTSLHTSDDTASSALQVLRNYAA
jgi:uncharacterized protein (TIGR03084 family)